MLRRLDSRRLAALIALVAVAASVARTIAGGQDLNFDLVTYHYYLGFSAFHDRLGLDFLPAGAAGYQSPLPYALLYLLDSLGVAPMLNAAIHAGLHALNLVVLLLLTKVLLRRTPVENSRVALLASWLLGAIAPVYWQLVGTSFADPLTSVLILGGVWLVAEALPLERPAALRILALGGLLAGAAVGLRLHNAIFVVALGGALLLLYLPARRIDGRVPLVFALAAGGAWMLIGGPWLLAVAHEFGNPIFPLYNGIFRSPDFPSANLQLVSFVPKTLVDAAMLPFRMASFQEWRFGEKGFPDVRPALLVLSAAGVAVKWADRRFARLSHEAPLGRDRAVVMLFFVIGAVLWLLTSANSRYGLALFLLAGPVCGALLYRVLPARYAALIIAAAVLWQGLQHQLFFKQYRWTSGPWTARYFDWQMPPALAHGPATYLSFGYQTASSLAPRLHPASRHASLVAQYSIGIEDPGRQRIERLIEAPREPIYGVFDYYYTQQDNPAARSIKDYFVEHVRLWGLDFSREPCTPIGLRPPLPRWRGIDEALGVVEYRGRPPMFLLCRLQAASAEDHAAAMLQYRRFEKTIASLAAACPGLLGPAVSIVRVRGEWQVTGFASAEYRLEFEDGGDFQMQLLRPPYGTLPLGKVTEKGILVRWPDCTTWFARLVG